MSILICLSFVSLQCVETKKVDFQSESQSKDIKKTMNQSELSPHEKMDPHPDISLPIYPSAINVERFIPSDMLKVKVVRYELKLSYPADKVIKYYNEQLPLDGWKHVKDHKSAKAKWYSYVDDTKEGSPTVRRFVKVWISEDSKKEFLFLLEYTREATGQWSDNLYVYSDIRPYIDFTKYEEFVDKMHNEQKWQGFIVLLDKYTNEDSTIDFEKAFKENPQNQDLVEYYQIHKEAMSNINKSE